MTSHHTIHHTQERTLAGGMLSVTSTFRLMVTGNTELKHLERLIRLLTIQKQILEEDEIEDLMPAAGGLAALAYQLAHSIPVADLCPPILTDH